MVQSTLNADGQRAHQMSLLKPTDGGPPKPAREQFGSSRSLGIVRGILKDSERKVHTIHQALASSLSGASK